MAIRYPRRWHSTEPTLAERLGAAMRDQPNAGFRDLWRACGGPDVDEFGDLLVRLLREAGRRVPDDD